MAKVFRPSNRESSILSRIESSKEHARRAAINFVRDDPTRFANPIAMKLVEEHLVETTNKNLPSLIYICCIRDYIRNGFM